MVPEVRRVLLLSLVVLAGCGSTAAKQAEQLQSLAAEGALMAHDVGEGDAWSPYTRAHAKELADEASSLESAAKTRELSRVARAVAGELEALAAADAREARLIEARLEELAERLA